MGIMNTNGYSNEASWTMVSVKGVVIYLRSHVPNETFGGPTTLLIVMSLATNYLLALGKF